MSVVGIAMLFRLPFDEDASGWGRRAATTCLAISAARGGVWLSFELSVLLSGFVGLSAISALFGIQGSINMDHSFGCLFQSLRGTTKLVCVVRML